MATPTPKPRRKPAQPALLTSHTRMVRVDEMVIKSLEELREQFAAEHERSATGASAAHVWRNASLSLLIHLVAGRAKLLSGKNPGAAQL